MRNHFTPIRIAIIQKEKSKTENTSDGENMAQIKPSGMATIKNSLPWNITQPLKRIHLNQF